MAQPGQESGRTNATNHGENTSPQQSLITPQLSLSTSTLDPQTSYTTSRLDDHHGGGTPVDDRRLSAAVVLWRPYSLYRRVFAAFAILFLFCIVGLEIICQISQHNQGLVSSVSGRHYLWAYGPTAITALWARVDYRLKQQAPWSAMAKRETPASKSILLDYIEPLQPVSIYKAVINGHYPVALSGTLSLLLALLIVVSTGLMSLDPVVLKNDHFSVHTVDSFTNQPLSFTVADFDNVAYNIPLVLPYAFQHYDLEHPFGTTDTVTFQSIDTSELPPQSVVDVIVDGFSIDFDCEDAMLSRHSWTKTVYKGGADISTDIFTASCKVEDVTVRLGNAQQQNYTSYFGNFQYGHCAGMDETLGHRLVTFVGKTVQHPFDDADGDQKMNVSIPESLQRICTPRYSIRKYQLTTNTSNPIGDSTITQVPDAADRTLSRVPVSDISKIFFIPADSVYVSGLEDRSVEPRLHNLLDTLIQGSKQIFMLDNPNYATQYCFATQGYSQDPTLDWLKPGVFEDLCRSTYRSFLAQFAKREIMRPNSTPTHGVIQSYENRLVVRLFIARVMEALLAVLFLLDITILLFDVSSAVLPRDVASLSGIAAVLAAQPYLRAHLAFMTTTNDRVVEEALDAKMYSSEHGQMPGKSPYLITEIKNPRLRPQKTQHDKTLSMEKWWRPVAVRRPVLVSMVVVVCTMIVALEIVLQISQRNQGLANANSTSYVHYVWSLVPAGLMTSIKFYYQAVNFSGKVFAPYTELRTGASYRESLAINFLDQMAPVSLWSSLRTNHVAVLFTTLTALIGSLLSIAVSGVYSVANVPFEQAVTVQRHDYFNYTNYQAGDQEQSAIITGLTLGLNLSYPVGTYEELLLPTLAIARNTSNLHEVTQSGSKLQARISAIYPEISCDVYKGSEVLSVSYEGGYLSADLPVRGNCGDGGTNNMLFSASGTFGEAYTPYWLQTPDLHDCTYLGYLWGHVQAGKIEHIIGLSCSERVAAVETDVTFLLPSFQVDPNNPPQRDTSTQKTFSTPSLPTYYDWLPISSKPASLSLDNFFLNLISGKNAIPASWLKSIDKVDEIEAAIIKLHQLVRAQQWPRSGMLVPIAPDFPLPQLGGTVSYSSRLRLVQNSTSTRILEGLLGAMVIGTGFIIVLLRTKEILTRCPCSVAGMASLLVDSRLLDRLPPSSSWMTDTQLLEVLGRYRYKLGWFRPGKGHDAGDSPVEAERRQQQHDPSGKARWAYGIYIEEDIGAVDEIESKTRGKDQVEDRKATKEADHDTAESEAADDSTRAHPTLSHNLSGAMTTTIERDQAINTVSSP